MILSIFSKRFTDMLCYFGTPGLILAIIFGNRESKFHMNQAAILSIGTIGLKIIQKIFAHIPILCWIVCVPASILQAIIFILRIRGVAHGFFRIDIPIPFIGKVHIIY